MKDLNSMSLAELEELLAKGEQEQEQYYEHHIKNRERRIEKNKVLAVTATLFLLVIAGCSNHVECLVPGNLPNVTYCLGKVAGDGQEGIFRDAWLDGKPMLSNFGGGPSLWGQALQGVAGDAALAGGAVGAAALLRPTRINESISNHQGQGQLQGQEQGQESNNTNVNANSNENNNSNRNNNRNHNNNTNHNSNSTKVGDIGGGGGVPGCQKAKFGC